MITKKSTLASMDEYIATFPEDVQKILKKVRSTIKSAVPRAAEETISYEIPTFKMNGKYLIYFAGWKNIFRSIQFRLEMPPSAKQSNRTFPEKAR